jgi:hypothetical protein
MIPSLLATLVASAFLTTLILIADQYEKRLRMRIQVK